MSDGITLKIDDKLLKDYLKKIEKKGTTLEPLLSKIKVIGLQSVEENFESQGRPKWEPLKLQTLKRRAKKGYTGGILQRTATLKKSVTGEIGKDKVTIGSNLEYAAVHQFGFRKRKIPARPFVKFTKDDINEMEDTILDHIIKE